MEHGKPFGSRKAHRKTRAGCVDCKRRRIKCDEIKPSCLNCRRQSLNCTYLAQRPKPQLDVDADTSEASAPPVAAQITPDARSFASPAAPLSLLPPPSQGLHDWKWEVHDLELLHLYTTVTSLSFSQIPQRQRIWQFIVPQIAFSHDFLLHGILAFAGVHLSYLQPQRKDELRNATTKHYNIASTSFRSAISKLTFENSGACFVFSTFVALYSWASSDNTGDLFFVDTSDRNGKERTVEWVHLLRGVHSLLEVYHHWIKDGPLGPLVEFDKCEAPPTEARLEYTAKFESLKQLWDIDRLLENSTAPFTHVEVEALNNTIVILTETYGIVVQNNESTDIVAVVFAWPILVPELYIQMVACRRPEALILLAHYCLLLTRLDHLWWIQGMSRHLLQTIHKVVGEEWEKWIVWPLQELVLSEFRNKNATQEEVLYGLPVSEH